MSKPALAAGIAAGAAVAAALLPLPPGIVERVYSTRIYPAIQVRLTPLSNRLPCAVGDVWLAAALVLAAAALVRRLRRHGPGARLRSASGLLLPLCTAAALGYLAMLLLWGLNYRRVPLSARLDYDERRATPAAAAALVERVVSRLEAEAPLAHAAPWPEGERLGAELAPPFAAAARACGSAFDAVPGRPKRSLIEPYLAAAGVDGVTNPFGLEVILNSELLPIERPFVLGHEWAHLAGFADESEAGFVGWVACVRAAHPALRYSGWLALYELLGPAATGRGVELAPLVRADLAAIRERFRRHYRPLLGDAQERIYDRFLKVNRVEEGVASYELLVRLVLGSRFEPDLLPARRSTGRSAPAR